VIDSLTACQRPTVQHLPPDIVDFTLGDIAVEFAAEMGLELYDWQAWCLRNILARRADGNWAARDSGLEVPRQNGKNAVLEALELYLVFLGGARLVVHSAHEQTTAAMHFNRLKELILASPDLLAAMPNTANGGFHVANGKERIELADGATISFKTRTHKTGRGPSPDAIILDEAMILTDEALGNMTPSMSARRKAMLVFTSSSPSANSTTLHRLRARALSGAGGRLFYAGWNSDPDVDPADEVNWFTCNPSLEMGDDFEGGRPGKQIDAMRADLMLMTPEKFAVEHLGIPEEPVGSGSAPIPLDVWEGLADGKSMATDTSVRLALDVGTDRRFSCFSVAGHRADNLGHVAVRDRRPGTDWVVARGAELAEGHKTPIIIAKGSPAASFIDEFERAGVAVDVMSPGDYAEACGRFIDATRGEQPQLRHRGDPNLRAALAAVAVKDVGDGAVTWSRKSSSTDITALTACTMAWGRVGDNSSAPEGRFYSMADLLNDE
jgi:hypothetical protein